MKKDEIGKLNKAAGILLILAAIDLVVFVLISQHLYPNYSLNFNYISDLGVGSTAAIFNSGMVIFGILAICASYCLWKTGKSNHTAIALLIIAMGGLGVGIFPETTGLYHIISAYFLFGTVAITAIGYSRVFKGIRSYYSLAAGLFVILVVVGYVWALMAWSGTGSVLGHGGVEEMLFYDEIIWTFVLGTFLIKKG